MKYIKVSVKKKNEARKLFEAGVDMVNIASKLNLNIGTLYNLSSKESWEKGINEELLCAIERDENLKSIAKLRGIVKDEYRSISQEIKLDIINKKAGADKRASALRNTYLIDKELYNLETPLEELELMKEKLRYETMKQELEEKKLDYEVKKLTAEHYLGKR